jgi:uncharacterized protein (TIRG00374 family)
VPVMRRRPHWRVWAGIGVSAILLWLALRGVDWSQLRTVFMTVSWTSCAIAALFFLGNLIVRAVRWHVLLTPVCRLPLLDVFAYSEIGYMANNLLPLRAGEIIRAMLVGHRHSVSKSAVLATIAVERVLDIISLLAFVLLVTPFMQMPQVVRRSILVAEIVAILVVATLWLVSWQEKRTERFVEQISVFIPRLLRTRVVNILVAFGQGLRPLRSPQRMVSSIAISLLAWALVLFEILSILHGFDLVLPWYAGAFTIVVLNLGIAIPSSPGFVGLAHYLIVLALSVFAVSQTEALGVALVTHGLGFVLNVVLGLAFLWRENVAFRQLDNWARLENVAEDT